MQEILSVLQNDSISRYEEALDKVPRASFCIGSRHKLSPDDRSIAIRLQSS